MGGFQPVGAGSPGSSGGRSSRVARSPSLELLPAQHDTLGQSPGVRPEGVLYITVGVLPHQGVSLIAPHHQSLFVSEHGAAVDEPAVGDCRGIALPGRWWVHFDDARCATLIFCALRGCHPTSDLTFDSESGYLPTVLHVRGTFSIEILCIGALGGAVRIAGVASSTAPLPDSGVSAVSGQIPARVSWVI